MHYRLKTEEETEKFGAYLFREIKPRHLVFLIGDLGAGKTTLVRGFLRAAGYTGTVKSPTFTLVEEYRIDHAIIIHFDLYRLNDPEELEWIGINDYLGEHAICFIEWPERGRGVLPEADLIISLQHAGEGRDLEIVKPSGRFLNFH